MNNRPFYHDGMRFYQDHYDGRRLADKLEQHRKHYAFWDEEKELIETTQFLFIATAWQDYVDCSVKTGLPGFVKVLDPNIIEYPEYNGNSMYRTMGNIIKNPNVGLLFVKFDGRSRRVRVNGQAEVLDGPEVIARHPGARFVIRIACEIFPNCPRRYLTTDLRSAETSDLPSAESPSPVPEWKRQELFRDHLPHDDPHRALVSSGRERSDEPNG